MKIIWTDFASKMLREIYDYHKVNASRKTAVKIKKNIFASTRQLKNHPEMGQLEPFLMRLNENHRYIVEGNYKIIYKKINDSILILDIFDTRQNPDKLDRNI